MCVVNLWNYVEEMQNFEKEYWFLQYEGTSCKNSGNQNFLKFENVEKSWDSLKTKGLVIKICV